MDADGQGASTKAPVGHPGRPRETGLKPGDRIAGRYRLGHLLGAGGMGEVYEAQDEELALPVALKMLHVDLMHEEQAVRRLKQEVLLARSITHPHVCRVYDLGRHGEGSEAVWFLTMELLRGETLRERVGRRGRLTMSEALPLVEQMVAGLSASHRAGIVHHDFKSGNVMVVEELGEGGHRAERVVVTDFGLAQFSPGKSQVKGEPGATRSRVLGGTPDYMAPEQVLGQATGTPADIYAFGVVLYELLTGRLPFEARTPQEALKRRLEEAPMSPRRLVEELDDRWETVILRCLAREPGQRFARMEEVAETLRGQGVLRAPGLPVPFVRFSLPAERDAFVGRTADLEEMKRKLAGSSRLLTLLGAAGMGKTRLAVRYGWQTLNGWPGGVWFCNLNEARSLEGIASAVGSTLGVPLEKADTVAQLGHAIAGRGRCLVVLDNFEQVVGHAEETVGQWMERAQEARFVVTSRERLGLRGEETQALEPLELDEGVQMLVERASRERPDFRPVEAELEATREVVRLVEGMPLAIELAAARVRVMSVRQVVERLQKRLRVLGGSARGRHGSLRAAIDGSWELLKPWEQAAWAQSAVFEGGFTLEAAEGVLDLSAWPEVWVVDVVQSLVDKCLLRVSMPEGGATGRGVAIPARIGMYASLQEYAKEKLHEAEGEGERSAEERHGRWYAGLGAGDLMGSPRFDVRVWKHELENLMAACRRAVERGDGDTASRTHEAAWYVLRLLGPFRVGSALGETVLKLPLTKAERARALSTLGSAEWSEGRMKESLAHSEAALAIYRELGDRGAEGTVLGGIAGVYRDQGRMKEAKVYFEAALAIAREMGNRHSEEVLLVNFSPVHGDDMEEAQRCLTAALAIAREVGDRWSEGIALANLGLTYSVQGRTQESRSHYESALAIVREQGDRISESTILGNLANSYYDQGRIEEARAHFEAALAICQELGNRRAERGALANLGIYLKRQGQMVEASARLETALAMAREVGDLNHEGRYLSSLGSLYYAWDRKEEALVHCESALAIAREIGDRFLEGVVLTDLGNLHCEQGRIEAAAEELALGEAIFREIKTPAELAMLLCARAKLEDRRGEVARARTTLHEAAVLAEQSGAGPSSELARELAELRQALSE